MVRHADPLAEPGDIVHVYDRAGKYFGRGIYNPRSQIVVRMLCREDRPIEADFWRERLERAVALRRQLRLDDVTDAYRLVHAEGDALSGLIVERFADFLVFEVFSIGMYQRCEQLAGILAEILGPPTSIDRPDKAHPTWRTVLRADSHIEKIEGFYVPQSARRLAKDTPNRVVITEHGVRYRIDVEQGHKTGFFCDHRDNRLRFAALCRDANVLDLCCYAGGFALGAAKLGGARSVTGVDLDESAIALAKENANLNQLRVDFVYADAFTYVRQMLANQRQFDAVVLDPPKLAVYRAEYDQAIRKYCDMNALAIQAVRPGGLLLTCSCSGLVTPAAFLDVVQRAAQRAGRTLQLFDRTGAGPDHPILLDCPESAYLKALWFRVL
jgi:23S rRNA (cytosine1962-C5)-methyltransferase